MIWKHLLSDFMLAAAVLLLISLGHGIWSLIKFSNQVRYRFRVFFRQFKNTGGYMLTISSLPDLMAFTVLELSII